MFNNKFMNPMVLNDYPFTVHYISDVETTYQFYKLLGAEVLEKAADKVTVNLGGHEIHFVLDSTEPFPEYQYITSSENRGHGVLFYVHVRNISEMFAHISDLEFTNSDFKSYKIVTPVKPNHWNCKEFLVEDPDGYKLVFWSEK